MPNFYQIAQKSRPISKNELMINNYNRSYNEGNSRNKGNTNLNLGLIQPMSQNKEFNEYVMKILSTSHKKYNISCNDNYIVES